MANDLIEIKANKNELMVNIKNIFLNEFLKKEGDIINLIIIFLNNYYY